MDFESIKIDLLKIRNELRKISIHADVMIIFGSQAMNRARPDSDIDMAIVSRDYGKNRFKENSELNFIAHRINPNIEAITISLNDYLNVNAPSPILHEIKTKGIVLF